MNTTSNILDVFEGFRMSPTPVDKYQQVGKSLLANKIDTFVSSNRPVDFVMLGFPFKSSNHRDKVIGSLPDMAEEVTLKNFALFNDRVKEVYEPGVSINIVSDGYVFNDLLGVSDNEVREYKEVSMDLGSCAPMKWYDVNDFYIGQDLMVKRDKIMSQFGITPETLEHNILFNPDVNFLYRGMMKFMTEELAINDYVSRSQLQKAAKILTRKMMFRNEAYSNLVKDQFSSMVRLSMHPSVNDGAKYSFQLIPSEKAKHSAWHCALAVNSDGEFETVHRKDAEQLGYQLVLKDGRPYYYTNS